jgi:hypothetical protein
MTSYFHSTAIARIGEPDAPTNFNGLIMIVNDVAGLSSSRLQKFSIMGIPFDNRILCELK